MGEQTRAPDLEKIRFDWNNRTRYSWVHVGTLLAHVAALEGEVGRRSETIAILSFYLEEIARRPHRTIRDDDGAAVIHSAQCDACLAMEILVKTGWTDALAPRPASPGAAPVQAEEDR